MTFVIIIWTLLLKGLGVVFLVLAVALAMTRSRVVNEKIDEYINDVDDKDDENRL